jgi:hypothetical protein
VDLEEFERRRRAIFLRATLLSYAFLAAGLLIAVGGSAGVAWMLTRVGLPFGSTWAILLGVVLLPSLIMIVVRAVRERPPPPR